jgi:ABC-type transport system involved in multi-copper enzyme maturation permease subunit
MSSVTAVIDRPLPASERDAQPSLARLTEIELRKMTDTRAGFWLLLAIAVLTVGVVIAVCIFGNSNDRTLLSLMSASTAPAFVLLPIVGILLVTSEWSQHTAMVTFVLVPRRSRVIVAKLAASVSLSLVMLMLCLLVALAATAVAGSGVADTWSLPVGMFGQFALALATAMAIGVGVGGVLLSSAPAIVVYFALPIAWSAIGSIHALEGVARWLDMSRSLDPLTDHLLSGVEWAHAATTLVLWLALPLLAGMWRIAHAEVRGT